MNDIPKYVASRTLTETDVAWNTTLLPADDAIGTIRKLVANDLVDEYRLMFEPILLGGGKRIFPADGAARPLELAATSTSGTGVLICTYRPAAS